MNAKKAFSVFVLFAILYKPIDSILCCLCYLAAIDTRKPIGSTNSCSTAIYYASDNNNDELVYKELCITVL